MPPTLPPDILARLERLELAVSQVVEGYLAGRHRSPRHGFAVEFAQHREYAPGDDIRHIDWRVYARTERYHLKQYEQETNLIAWLFVDASESMTVGTRGTTKYHAAATLAGALAHLITQQSDSVGLALYSETIDTYLRPKGQSGQVREALRALAAGPFPRPARLADAVRAAADRTQRRGVVFVFSDFLDELDDIDAALKVFRSQKHDVTLFQVLDPAEVDFPFRQPTLFKGLESSPEVSTDPLSIRETYLAQFGQHQAALESLCRSLGVDLQVVRTDADLGQALATFLNKRAK